MAIFPFIASLILFLLAAIRPKYEIDNSKLESMTLLNFITVCLFLIAKL